MRSQVANWHALADLHRDEKGMLELKVYLTARRYDDKHTAEVTLNWNADVRHCLNGEMMSLEDIFVWIEKGGWR